MSPPPSPRVRTVGAALAALTALSVGLAPVRADGPVATATVPPGMVEVEDGHTGETVLIPASELEPPPTATAEEGDGEPPRPGTAEADRAPRRWLHGSSRCSRYHRRRFCDGPLRVPEPFGPEADLARRLGLGSHAAGGRALDHEPLPAWRAEVAGYRPNRQLLWPVDGGHIVRGLKRPQRVRVVTRVRGHRRVRTVTRPGHRGVDIGARPGTHALAIAPGLVVYSNNEMRGYGNVVVILHGDGTVSLYAHLRAAWVFPGMHVRRGQILGEIGETGLARGPHLHFEWRRNGVALDPIPHFVGRPAAPGAVTDSGSPEALAHDAAEGEEPAIEEVPDEPEDVGEVEGDVPEEEDLEDL